MNVTDYRHLEMFIEVDVRSYLNDLDISQGSIDQTISDAKEYFKRDKLDSMFGGEFFDYFPEVVDIILRDRYNSKWS